MSYIEKTGDTVMIISKDKVANKMVEISNDIVALEYLARRYKDALAEMNEVLTTDNGVQFVSTDILTYDAGQDIEKVRTNMFPISLLPEWVRACAAVEADEAKEKYNLDRSTYYDFMYYIAYTIYREAFNMPYYMNQAYLSLHPRVGKYVNTEKLDSDIHMVKYQLGLKDD